MKFFDPDQPVERHRHRLPHWQQGDVIYYVTWRLFDSLPMNKVRQWVQEKEIWLRLHPRPWDAITEKEYYQQFSDRIDQWLDQGMESCVFRDPTIAGMLPPILLHFSSERYRFIAFVIMPNHVHTLFQLIPPHRLGKVVGSWRKYSARQINRVLGRKGSLWQDDYWDRMIRGPRHLYKCLDYIRNNPVKASLKSDEYILFDSLEETGSPDSS